MKKELIIIFAVVAIFIAGIISYLFVKQEKPDLLNPVSRKTVERPLDKYSFMSLVNREEQPTTIVKDSVMEEGNGYTSYLFSYTTEEKRVTGQLNIPNGEGDFPLIVMLRGYVPVENYQTGTGTKNAAAYFARNGYVTLAPDFLGYGGSDLEDVDTFAARVKRPVAVLDLLAGIDSLDEIDVNRVYIWGHSNGGQIGISVLEVLGKRGSGAVKAASFWAPVTKPFPYSILYYTDESNDAGKELRRTLAEFENKYDVFDFSIDMYIDWLNTPISIHQGSADDAVPKSWSDEFVEKLERLDKDITYYEYIGADHNMRPVWNTVVARDLDFFRNY